MAFTPILPAHANSQATGNSNQSETSVLEQMGQDLDQAADRVGNALTDAVEGAENAANNLQRDMRNPNPAPIQPVATTTVYETLSIDGNSANNIRAAALFDQSGEQIGQVDDVIYNTITGERHVLVDIGGILSLTDDTYTVPYDTTQLVQNSPRDLRMIVSTNGERPADGMLFDTDLLNSDEYMALGDMIGSDVALTVEGETPDLEVSDVMLTMDGTPAFAILAVNAGLFTSAEKLIAVEFEDLLIEQGDGAGYVLNMSVSDLNDAPSFVYQ